jgi:clumping factor A
MIPVSVLLILVAVTLLILGLAGGSSTLLIGSIVASLLAAVALVIGARQAASQRRAAMAPDGLTADVEEDPPVPAGARAASGAARSRRTAFDFSSSGRGPDDFAGSPHGSAARAGSDFSSYDERDAVFTGSWDDPDATDARSGPAVHADDPRVGAPLSDSYVDADEPAPTEDRDARFGRRAGENRHDAGRDGADEQAPGHDRAARSGRQAGETAPDDPDRDASHVPGESPTGWPGFAGLFGDPDAESGYGPDADAGRAEPDYDRASSVIGSARSGEPADAWRRDPDAEAPPVSGDPRTGAYAEGAAAAGAAFASGEAGASADTTRRGERPPDQHGRNDALFTDDSSGEEFAEPDEDDPEDEPLPQAVRPGDAVQVARMDAEVLVVDGRPRYHLADCRHLLGKLTEPLPANEAVELGFSPCGLCRPVDRLVARATHR